MPLSKHLQPIYDLELLLGNTVSYQISNETCPMYIAFTGKLHRAEIEKQLMIAPCVIWKEYRDTHYTLEAGYVCQETNTAVVGAA